MSKREAVEYSVHGLKCDNPICDYRDEFVQLKDYKKWINAPCPKCGAPLLTEADMKLTLKLVKIAKVVNFFYKLSGKNIDNEPKYEFKVDMNGTGEEGMTLSDPKEIK